MQIVEQHNRMRCYGNEQQWNECVVCSLFHRSTLNLAEEEEEEEEENNDNDEHDKNDNNKW